VVNKKRGAENEGTAETLWTLLGATGRVETGVEAALGEVGLSLAKLGVLAHLVESGEPLPLGQLAGRISCVRSNMTQLIDRLEADGLVERVNDPADRRSVRAAITREGRRRHNAGAQIIARQEAELFKDFASAERKQLLNLLARLGGV
jgi:DNA-binding MarR family transcriptional regulator